MSVNKKELSGLKEEKVTQELKELYSMSGYRRYKMSNFENYDLYVNHKDFLNGTRIVTFSDARGKLKALKPDVTMSIIKNTKNTDKINKLYYIENVFRTSPVSGDIKEIRQMGVEFIGCNDVYSQAETVMLAMQSLEVISSDNILTVSHMGFVTSLLNSFNISTEEKKQMRELIKDKNTHELVRIAKNSMCNEEQISKLKLLISLFGEFESTLKSAKQLICCKQAEDAYNDLCEIYNVIKNFTDTKKIKLDLSVLSNADYYNGIILHGYVKQAPGAVLVGGRYDNMMRHFNKPQNAFGFAVYLAELDRAFASASEYDVDTLLIYKSEDSAQQIMQTVMNIKKQGKSIIAVNEKEIQNNIRCKTTLKLSNNGEVVTC